MVRNLWTYLTTSVFRHRGISRTSQGRPCLRGTVALWVCTGFLALICTLLTPLAGTTQEFRVFDAKFEVDGPQDGSGAPGLDYYINGGKIDGLRRSMLLDVYRAKTVLDDYHGQDITVRILVGQLQVLRVYRDTAIARIHTVHPSAVSPILRYRTVMVGDYTIPRTSSSPRAGNISLPSSVLFAYDSAVLKASAHRAITAAYKLLSQSPEHVLVVAGHTCNLGSEQYNLTLSQQRAQSVARFLTTTLGVPPNRVAIRGYGESVPLTSNYNETERSMNRRVDFRLIPRSASLPTTASSPQVLNTPLASRAGLR